MTITKRELVNKVAAELGDKASQNEVLAVVQATIDAINAELAQGNTVVFRNFGTFMPVTRKAKVGRNPKNPAVDVAIPERTVVKFKPGALLKNRAGKH